MEKHDLTIKIQMATNQLINELKDEISQFDSVTTQIDNTFDYLIDQLKERRYVLLDKLKKMRDDYIINESTRKDALEELIAAQILSSSLLSK